MKRRKPGVPVWKAGDGSRTLGHRLARAVGSPYPPRGPQTQAEAARDRA